MKKIRLYSNKLELNQLRILDTYVTTNSFSEENQNVICFSTFHSQSFAHEYIPMLRMLLNYYLKKKKKK